MRSTVQSCAAMASLAVVFATTAALGQEPGATAPAIPHADDTDTWEKAYGFIKMWGFETLWYLHVGHAYAGDPDDGYGHVNAFSVSRGYVTVKVRPAQWYEGRITLDASQDSSGDMKVRLKYLYGMFKVPVETRVVTEPFLEFGIVHMPWLDYEEHINRYRCQGTMFMERSSLFNSADFGATAGTLLGSKLSKQYRESVSDKYPGSWGSVALGVYNGGGYHAKELNLGKVFEGRVSLRPGGPFFPYLQLSYFVIAGRSNMEKASWDPPLWLSHAAMASLEHPYVVVTGQFVVGKGNQKATFVDMRTGIDPATGEAIDLGIEDVHDYIGASGYFELKLPWIWSSVIGRYDWFRKEGIATQRIIAGWAFHFFKFHKNLILLDADYVIPDGKVEGSRETWEVKLTLQVNL